jgi:hypothetical protein
MREKSWARYTSGMIKEWENLMQMPPKGRQQGLTAKSLEDSKKNELQSRRVPFLTLFSPVILQ